MLKATPQLTDICEDGEKAGGVLMFVLLIMNFCAPVFAPEHGNLRLVLKSLALETVQSATFGNAIESRHTSV